MDPFDVSNRSRHNEYLKLLKYLSVIVFVLEFISVTATISFLLVFCFWALVGLWALTCAYIVFFLYNPCTLHFFINQLMKPSFSLSKLLFTLPLSFSVFTVLAFGSLFYCSFTAIGHFCEKHAIMFLKKPELKEPVLKEPVIKEPEIPDVPLPPLVYEEPPRKTGLLEDIVESAKLICRKKG